MNAPASMPASRLPRSLQIAVALGGFGWAWWRLHRRAPETLPTRLRETLESLGTTFVKLGQGMSLRRDLLPGPYLVQLEALHAHVPPFESALAVETIETAFGQPLDRLFAAFEPTPFAAASVAQVHRAQMPDGRDVAVKVRRPGIVAQVHADLKLLRRFARVGQWFFPGLRRYQPLDLIEELAQFLHEEIDMVQEARNMRRLASTLDPLPYLTLPHVVEPLVASAVIVQEYSHGAALATRNRTPRGRELAGLLLDAYVHQLMGAGVFHADPHPGNLFELPDGRLCLHDFGSVGFLDPAARVALAQLIEGLVNDDASTVLDAVVAMGFVEGPIDRRAYLRAISEILSRLATLPLNEWSMADAIWRVARIGAGANFRLPRHLLVLMRTLFLVENTLRALDPDLDLVQALEARAGRMTKILQEQSSGRPLHEKLLRSAEQLPTVALQMLRQLQLDEGRPGLSLHHRGLEPLETTVARTGNRLALALVTLGLYVAGSVMMLHGGGPRLWGHLPVLSALAFTAALVLSWRLVRAISRSGHL
jgi:ubiquinone biosynthesis protein